MTSAKNQTKKHLILLLAGGKIEFYCTVSAVVAPGNEWLLQHTNPPGVVYRRNKIIHLYRNKKERH